MGTCGIKNDNTSKMKVEYTYEWFEANADHFNKWFDPDAFDWEYSDWLAAYCSQHFNKWFDPDAFNWYCSQYLARYCYKHFETWWDANKFNWQRSYYLTKFCSSHIDVWYDPKRFVESKEDLIWEHLASKMEGHINEN